MDRRDQRVYLINKVTELIENSQIRDFVIKALEHAPDYIWEINASTSGEYHHNETQTEHVLQALALAKYLERVLDHPSVAPFIQPDSFSILCAIVALHDLFKCGLPGQERHRENGSLATDPLHPIYPAEALKNIMVWSSSSRREVRACDCDWWPAFADGVMGHMGPWSPVPFDRAALRDLSNLTLLGFLCDYFASRKGVEVAY